MLMSMGIPFRFRWCRGVEGEEGTEIGRGVWVGIIINRDRDMEGKERGKGREEKVEGGRRDIVGITGGIMRKWRLGGKMISGDLSVVVESDGPGSLFSFRCISFWTMP